MVLLITSVLLTETLAAPILAQTAPPPPALADALAAKQPNLGLLRVGRLSGEPERWLVHDGYAGHVWIWAGGALHPQRWGAIVGESQGWTIHTGDTLYAADPVAPTLIPVTGPGLTGADSFLALRLGASPEALVLDRVGARTLLRWVDLGAGQAIGPGVDVTGWMFGPTQDRRILLWEGYDGPFFAPEAKARVAVAHLDTGELHEVGTCPVWWTHDTAIPHPRVSLGWGSEAVAPRTILNWGGEMCTVDPLTERLIPPQPLTVP